ncbi:MAG: proton-conducting membrane transporter [Agathobacter sp.]|nr:proton-conducting membrane transporter [Agathobacter sp.]
MDQSVLILFAIFIPIVLGVYLLARPDYKSRVSLVANASVGFAITTVLSLVILIEGDLRLDVFTIGKNMNIYFHVDDMSRVFGTIVTIVMPLVGIYAFEYMSHYKKEEKRFFGFFLMVYGVLLALTYAGNVVTFYLFYELMSLSSVPLVFHFRSREAIMAGLKYLFYSLCGAYFVLFGIYFLNQYTITLDFVAGGTLNMARVAGSEGLLLVVAMSMIIGFGVKAGMIPLHAWLPNAHPIAPAPASAALSSLIVKMGVFGVMRVVYYLFGAEFLRGTWVQYTWLTLTLITVFFGSMMAYREKQFKKRLAYSTVSQVSYILFGMALMQSQALIGSVLHILFHAVIKSALFLSAGAIIYKTGVERVDEMRGIGKKMPKIMWSFTLCSLALIGIPPASGFISKWYLATGSLATEIPVIAWLGPVVLLVSALLTAGYLLPIAIDGFFPGPDFDYKHLEKKDPTKQMIVPIMILAALAVLFGVLPNPVISYVTELVASVL